MVGTKRNIKHMEKSKLNYQDAREQLIAIFGCIDVTMGGFKEVQAADEPQNMVSHGRFYIDKRRNQRLEVIQLLNDWLQQFEITGFYIEVHNLTFVYTTFEIKPVEELQKVD